jgi:hypothetical protein
MNVIEIDFTVLGYIIIGLFALVGFFRGWWREGVTTIFLVLLAIILTQPAVADAIIRLTNRVLEFLKPIITISLDAGNRNIYVYALIILITLSYLVGKIGLGGYAVAPLGAVMGGVLGAVNGFIISSLFKEYILGRFRAGAEVSAAAASADTASVQIKGLGGPRMAGELFWVIVFVGIVVLVLLVSTRFRLAKPKPMIEGKAPAGYK